jgi:hypothetical protein
MSNDWEMLIKLVILGRNLKVLMDANGDSFGLPEVTIPRYMRFAYSANVAAREKYGLELFDILSVSTARDSDESGVCIVARLQSETSLLPVGLVWKDPDSIQSSDRASLDAALGQFDLYHSGAEASNFGKYDSLDELRAWYRPFLDKLGVRETNLLQWNGDQWFQLFRIAVEPTKADTPDTPDALWFKAVGHPNTREYAVIHLLTDEFPRYFPAIVGSKPEWNGWLMKEVRGHELDQETTRRPWSLTARLLAKIQKHFIGREDELLALGCRDWRMPKVLDALDPFFDSMEEIMPRQTKNPPRILTAGELRAMKIQCRELCKRVEDLGIPETIAHGDFSPHNVIVSNSEPYGHPWMIDWAEAYVTFPFVSWEYFWNRTMLDHPEHLQWKPWVHGNYAVEVWEPLLGKKKTDAGLRLSPAMAVLLLAMYDIHDPAEFRNPDRDKVKRSLTRRLHRELEVIQREGAELAGATR